MTSLQVRTDEPEVAPRLNIEDYDIEKLRLLAREGGVLYWCNAGMWRKIVNPVLGHVLSFHDDQMAFLKRHPGGWVPPHGLIEWDAGFPITDQRAASSAPLLPRHQQSQHP